MNAAALLIEELEAIAARNLPWSFVARSHARALRRNSPPRRSRPREDALNRIEGAEEIIRACDLLDGETAARLGELIIEAWMIHHSGEWPERLRGGAHDA
ncbi:hypothetical protein [Halomonas sp. C05BenzN]|uniref:hypothetical protein n=1 Tax=Halomonas sp. C05BenzN TaxID=3411041 RepID=UPI003B96579D